jgi:hypothetical protein
MPWAAGAPGFDRALETRRQVAVTIGREFDLSVFAEIMAEPGDIRVAEKRLRSESVAGFH